MGIQKVFFVYGTLKTGECRAHVFNKVLGHNNFKRYPAIIKGDLYDLGSFPGMCRGNDNIAGEAIVLDEEDFNKMLPVLDQIEGYVPGRKDNLYVREEVELSCTEKPMKATTYFFSNTEELKNYGKRILSGKWSTHSENL